MRFESEAGSQEVMATTTLTTSYQYTTGVVTPDVESVDFMMTYVHGTGTIVVTVVAECYDADVSQWHVIPAEDTALVHTDYETTRSLTADKNYQVTVPARGHQVRIGIKDDTGGAETMAVRAIRRRGV